MKKFLLLTFLMSVFLFFPKNAFAKSYSIPQVNIDVTLNFDGSARITETRTYNFDGSFSWADEWINTKAKCTGCSDYIISDVSLTSGGVEVEKNISDYGDKFYVKWYYSAFNEARTFNFSYTVKNALINNTDTSEFYWQLIGDKWNVGTAQVNALLHLPAGIDAPQIKAFRHGPLNGIIKIVDNRTVTFNAENLPSKTFFEVRVLFPKLTNAIYAQNSDKTLTDIINEEHVFARQTQIKGIGELILFFVLVVIPIVPLV